MTIDDRVDEIMHRIFIWIEAGVQKPFEWGDGDKCDFVYLEDESLRRFVIKKIIEAGRRDGAEEMREKCEKMATKVRQYREMLNQPEGAHAARLIESIIQDLDKNAGEAGEYR